MAHGWKRELLPPGLKFLCVHRDDRGRLFAGGYDGLWMRDAAGTWSECPMRGKKGYATFIHDIASANGTVYTISTNGTINTSGDGARWVGRKTGIKHNGARVLALGDGRVIAFQERAQLAISKDSAKTFELANVLRVDDVWFDRAANVVYAAGYDSLARSSNGGATWTSLAWSGSANGIYADGDVILVASGKRIMRSEDAGQSWSAVYEGDSPLTCIRGLGQDAYVGGYGGTVLRSRDGGRTWSREDLGLFANLHGIHCARDAVYVVGDDSVVMVLGEGAREMSSAATRRSIDGWSAPPSPLAAGKRPLQAQAAYAAPPQDQHCAHVASVVWADARTLVSMDDAGRVLRWAQEDREWRARVLVPLSLHRAEHLAVLAGLVVGIDDGWVRAFELSGGDADIVPVKIGYWTTQLAHRRDRLFALDSDPFTTLRWDAATREFVPELERRGRVLDVDATGESVLLYREQTWYVQTRADGAEVAKGRGPKYLSAAVFGTSADVVIVQDDKGLLEAIDTRTKRRHWKLARRVSFGRVVPDAAHRYAACFGRDDSFAVIDLAQGTVVLDVPPSDRDERVTAAAISPDGEKVAIGRADGRVAVHPIGSSTKTLLSPGWRPPRRRMSTRTLVRGPCQLTARDGGRAVVVTEDARVTLVDIDRGGVHELGALPVAVQERAHATLAGDTLLVWDGANATTAIDIAAGEVLWSRVLPIARWCGFDARHAYAFQGHSSYAMGARIGHTLYRLDVRDGSFEQCSLPIPDGAQDAEGYGAALSRVRDGLLAGFTTEDGRSLVCIFDPSRGSVRVIANARRESDDSIVNAAVRSSTVSRSGRHVAPDGGSPEDVIVCDLDTASVVARITIGKPGRRNGVLFAPAIAIEHDRIAAVLARTGELHVWNARGEPLCRYESPTEVSDSTRSAFSTDGHSLTLFANSGVVQVEI